MKSFRFVFAAIASAFSAAAGYPLYFILIDIVIGDATIEKSISVLWLFLPAALIVTTAHVVMFGIPVFLLLQYLKALTFRNIAIAGLLAGSIPVAFFDSTLSPWTGVFGFLGAVGFWIVWEPNCLHLTSHFFRRAPRGVS